MRVIAGTQKGRRLHGPKGPGLRPTADRVKEALFSILGSRVAGARVLDLYAGTGAIGIEALSRGAHSVTFVEPDPAALRVLRSNLVHCGIEASADIQACTAETFLRRSTDADAHYDIVFADPPYQTEHNAGLWSALADTTAITSDTLVVLEHSSKLAVPQANVHLRLLRQYRYGDTTLSVFGMTAQDTPPL